MIVLKNRSYQPLTFHKLDGEETLHLPSRGRVTLPSGELTTEMNAAFQNGLIDLTEVADPPKPRPLPSSKGSRKPARSKPRKRSTRS